MRTYILMVTLVNVLMLRNSLGLPQGAPKSACQTLTPRHRNISPQRDRSPFTVTASKENGKIIVTIQSPDTDVEGFILQARSRDDEDQIVEGTFTTQQGISKTTDCFQGRRNTLTHENPEKKERIRTEWTPAPGVDEYVIFKATVAASYSHFWTDVNSFPLRVKGDDNTNINNGEGGKDNEYSSCGVSKGCFGLPSNCVDREDCLVFVSFSVAGNGVRFTMEGPLQFGNYMATGISTDARMGEDSVIECFLRNGRMMAEQSWNSGKTNERIGLLRDDLYQGSYVDGRGKCSWTQSYETVVRNRTFNLVNNTYHILVARGPVNGDRIGYHEAREATGKAVKLTAYESISSEGVSTSIKIHGEHSPSTEPSPSGTDVPRTSTRPSSSGVSLMASAGMSILLLLLLRL